MTAGEGGKKLPSRAEATAAVAAAPLPCLSPRCLETMLLATFKLCAGSSYRHVRNMKGEFWGVEAMWLLGRWGEGRGGGHSALISLAPLVG